MAELANPFRPGAGHTPPYLAGRAEERSEFVRLLAQETILENLILTGLRGVGKTVLLESLKPKAIESKWLWIGTDLNESASISEDNLAIRLCTDLSMVTDSIVVSSVKAFAPGFASQQREEETRLTYDRLRGLYASTPGLPLDKLKAVVESSWTAISQSGSGSVRGIVFAYDEAQNLEDHAKKEQFPLSLLLDMFQSLQRKGLPLLLVLTGLPTLIPKLVQARTFTERMFRSLFLDKLTEAESREAIRKPIEEAGIITLTDESVDTVIELSGGYPYFIQFICREVYDAFMVRWDKGESASVPVEDIVRKLDSDFFSGRWTKATDRQRELLSVIARLENCDDEFTVQEIVEKAHELSGKPFGRSHVNQMLSALATQGMVFKNRHGKYSFAVPLLADYIKRLHLGEST